MYDSDSSYSCSSDDEDVAMEGVVASMQAPPELTPALLEASAEKARRSEKRKAPDAWTPHEEGTRKWRKGCERSIWNDYFEDWVLTNPECLRHREFRQKFRIPLKMFSGLLGEMRASGFRDIEVEDRDTDAAGLTGARPHPLKLKLCACLRELATGCTFAAIEDMAFMSKKSMRQFFDRWLEWMVQEQYPKHVRWPTRDELNGIFATFDALGQTGAAA